MAIIKHHMDITIRKGNGDDTGAYCHLLQDIRQHMPHPEWFFIDPEEETFALLEQGQMELWLAERDGQLAGVFSIVHPGAHPYNLGYDLNLAPEELSRVVHMDTAAVHPDFRGHRLQQRLMEAAETSLQNVILLCTVHPENKFSLENLQHLGYQQVKTVAKYGSVRHILRKDLP